jgi:hypothetical protein
MVVENRNVHKRDKAKMNTEQPDAQTPGPDADVLPIHGSSESSPEIVSEVGADKAGGDPAGDKKRAVFKVDKLPEEQRKRGTYFTCDEVEFRLEQLAKQLDCHKMDLVRALTEDRMKVFKIDKKAKAAWSLLTREGAEVA